jgi:hypothetical protein
VSDGAAAATDTVTEQAADQDAESPRQRETTDARASAKPEARAGDTAAAADADLKCTFCGLRACWTE